MIADITTDSISAEVIVVPFTMASVAADFSTDTGAVAVAPFVSGEAAGIGVGFGDSARAGARRRGVWPTVTDKLVAIRRRTSRMCLRFINASFSTVRHVVNQRRSCSQISYCRQRINLRGYFIRTQPHNAREA